MQRADLFLLFVEKLNRLELPYMVTGSVASILYGEPRLTHDIDIILDLKQDSLQRFIELFPEDEYYCPPLEVIRVETQRSQRGHFNLIHHETGFKADVYPIGNDPFQRWALDLATEIPFEKSHIIVAPPEYVIVRKLEFHREGGSQKHLEDIAGIFRHCGDELDRSLLKNECANRGLTDLLDSFLN